jgi:hypothetical protein
LQQRQDIRLNRDIEGRQNLVAQKNKRLGDKSACYCDSLTFPSRQLIGESVSVGNVQTDIGEYCFDSLPNRRRRKPEEKRKRPSQNVANSCSRVQRSVGILKYELDVTPLLIGPQLQSFWQRERKQGDRSRRGRH